MHEKLVSYVLGELDAEEAAEFEKQLESDPALAAEAERLSRCLDPANNCDDAGPPNELATPAGLADRTADSVTMLASELYREPIDPPRARCSFSLMDAAVAVGVVAAVGMMLLPALRDSRESSRRMTCENNLKEIGRALQSYAKYRGGHFPAPPPNTNAGAFTITISHNGYIDRERLSELVVCPGSPEANQVAAGKLKVDIPNFDELEAAKNQALAHLRRVMALNVAYRLPCRKSQGVHPIKNCRDNRAPLLSDAPTIVDGKWRSLNHGGGFNVLYQNCTVRYQIGFRDPVRKDHFFVNTDGQQSMPTSPHDTVLVRSEFVPQLDGLSPKPKTRLLRVSP